MNNQLFCFFVITPVGFERICSDELKYWWPFLLNQKLQGQLEELPDIRYFKGGFEIDCLLETGLQLNRVLKTATRILLRLKTFDSFTVSHLLTQLDEIDWSFLKNRSVSWQVSITKSKIKHKGRLSQSLNGFVERHGLKSLVSGEEERQLLYCRIVEDRVTMSVDTSGNPLYKRGYREHVEQASLRENLAAGVLFHLMEKTTWSDLKNICLIDPMCGAGTFLFEANQILTSHFRTQFQYQKWNLNDIQWLRTIESKHYFSQKTFFSYKGYDCDSHCIESSKKNLQSGAFDNKLFEFKVKDVFFSEKEELNKDICWVICNPPYGKRMKIKSPYSEYYQNLFQSIDQSYKPQKFVVILSQTVSQRGIQLPLDWTLRKTVLFENSGFPVKALFFENGHCGCNTGKSVL